MRAGGWGRACCSLGEQCCCILCWESPWCRVLTLCVGASGCFGDCKSLLWAAGEGGLQPRRDRSSAPTPGAGRWYPFYRALRSHEAGQRDAEEVKSPQVVSKGALVGKEWAKIHPPAPASSWCRCGPGHLTASTASPSRQHGRN